MSEDQPAQRFVCTLPPPELRRRRAEVLSSVRRRAEKIEETPSGFVFTFPKSDGLGEELMEFVRFEAACCSFIEMQLTETSATFELAMHGAPGVKPFIKAELVDVSTEEARCGCTRTNEVKP